MLLSPGAERIIRRLATDERSQAKLLDAAISYANKEYDWLDETFRAVDGKPCERVLYGEHVKSAYATMA